MPRFSSQCQATGGTLIDKRYRRGLQVPATCAAVIWCFTVVQGQEDSVMARKSAAYQMLAQPGPEHEMLATLVGEWDNVITMWPEPGADPVTTEAMTTNEMVLGGRFLMTTGSGMLFGQEFERITFIGFDRRHKRYNIIGMDNGGTYWVTGSGTYSEKTKSITMSGEDVDPIAKFTQVYDFVITIASEDEYRTEVIFRNPEMTGGADEFKMIDAVSKRRK